MTAAQGSAARGERCALRTFSRPSVWKYLEWMAELDPIRVPSCPVCGYPVRVHVDQPPTPAAHPAPDPKETS